MNILIIFGALIFIRVITNYYNYRRLNTLSEQYDLYVEYLISGSTLDINVEKIIQSKSEIIELFEKSGISKSTVPYATPVGLGFVSNGNADVWENAFVNDTRVISLMRTSFVTAIGVYKLKIKQSINPIFWVESIIFLPRTIFHYLGADPHSTFIKILNLLYWICSVFYAIYNDRINLLIQDFLSKLFK